MDTPRMQAGDRPGHPLYIATIGPIRLAGTVMGVIGLEPSSGTAGARDLADACGWPAWAFGGPSVLTLNDDWIAIFDGTERALRAIVRMNADDEVGLVLFEATATIEIGPTVWDALEQADRVLLCGVVEGGPATANLTAATAAGELHAIVADVHIAHRTSPNTAERAQA
ncbi:hypothetical protein [Streptomyces sp. NPDC048527]|uniref:hypothetical protein n=1 Tax=Streptomyces sp. NPDC048527 TaxID=3365568 RepID=UPI003722725B